MQRFASLPVNPFFFSLKMYCLKNIKIIILSINQDLALSLFRHVVQPSQRTAKVSRCIVVYASRQTVIIVLDPLCLLLLKVHMLSFFYNLKGSDKKGLVIFVHHCTHLSLHTHNPTCILVEIRLLDYLYYTASRCQEAFLE